MNIPRKFLKIPGTKRATAECENCNNIFERHLSRFNQGQKYFYCNKNCQNEAQKGPGYIDPAGYVRMTRTGHPLAGTKGYILQHWFVLYNTNPEFALWAKENKWTIHHKNAIKNDNNLENLEWRAPGQHPQGWKVETMIEALEKMGYEITKPNQFDISKTS